jgi:hypothetical protein
MNFDEISGPRIPDAIERPVQNRKVSAVFAPGRSPYINANLSRYEALDYYVQDKVTISDEARRRFKKLAHLMSSDSRVRTIIVP